MEKTNKVLIIAYYWPPSGGSGVQRWVKFAKYLRDFGWEPIIYTPSNPERPAVDHSLSKDLPPDLTVIQRPIFEPYSFYKRFVGLKKEDKLGSALMSSGKENSFLQSLSIWIRGNFFIPDARKFWIKPSVRFLKKYLASNPVDAIISTGPPHSMHMIGMHVSRHTNIPWLADFRDPWTNIDFFDDLKLTPVAKKKHFKLEKKVLDSADRLVVVSPTMKREFSEVTQTEISVITNGYDEDDFSEPQYQPTEKFTLCHVGMMTPSRNPQILWQALSELKNEQKEFSSSFQLKLIGKVDASITADIATYKLEELVAIEEYVPHNEIVKIQQQADSLLLIVNNTPNAALILTGKLFEYLAAQRPILCISPVEGDITNIIKDTASGSFILYDQKDILKQKIIALFEKWKSGNHSFEPVGVEQYSRKSLSKKMAEELTSIIS